MEKLGVHPVCLTKIKTEREDEFADGIKCTFARAWVELSLSTHARGCTLAVLTCTYTIAVVRQPTTRVCNNSLWHFRFSADRWHSLPGSGINQSPNWFLSSGQPMDRPVRNRAEPGFGHERDEKRRPFSIYFNSISCLVYHYTA